MVHDIVIIAVNNGGQWAVLDSDSRLPSGDYHYQAKYMIDADEVSEVTTQGPALFVRGQPVPPYFIESVDFR